MAALPIIDDTFRVALGYESGGELVARNIIHHFGPGLNAVEVADLVDTNFTTEMIDATSAEIDMKEIEVTPLDGISATFTKVLALGVPGGAAGVGVPNGAGVVTFNTDKRGRSFQGRAYTPWISEGVQSEGLIESANVINIIDAWVQYAVTMLVEGCAQVVASYVLAEVNAIQNVLMDRRLDTQRRRLNVIGT